MIGIPLTILAILAAIIGASLNQNLYYIIAAILLIIGYALQFIGHHIEGNDAGEIILIKKILGKEYIDIARQYKNNNNSTDKKS